MRYFDIMPTLHWDEVAGNDAYHVTSLTLHGRSSFYDHDHDFAELFLVDTGRGLHLCGGQRQDVSAGDLFTVLPHQSHGFQACTPEGFRYLNVAISADTLAFFTQTYVTGADGLWDPHADTPVRHRLSPARMRVLQRAIEELSLAPRTRSEIDRFLLNLLHEIREPLIGPQAAGMPTWLRRAYEELRSLPPDELSVTALVDAAGRSHEHVSRVTRATTGMTPTQLVTALRLTHAAHLLSMTDDDITRIALSCGFQHMGHFHKAFRAQYDTTPRRYRVRSKGMGGGE